MISKTIGELLKQERQQRGVSLSELSAKTKVRLEFLEALESGDLSCLPAAPFVKGYIRACARVLSLDSDSLIAVLRRDYKQDYHGQLISRSLSGKNHPRWWSSISISWMGLAVLGLFVSILVYGGYKWYQATRPPHLELTSPADQATVASQVEVSGYTDHQVLLLVNDRPVALNPDGSFATTVELTQEGLAMISVQAFDQKNRVTKIDRVVFVEF